MIEHAAARLIPSPEDDEFFEFSSLTSSSGMRFAPKLEARLDPALRALARKLPNARKGVVAVAEVPGPVGVPDFIALPNPGEALQTRLTCGIQPILNWREAQVVANLHRRMPKSIYRLSHELGTSEKTVQRALRELQKKGALELNNGKYVKNPALAPVGRLYALEAKVEDWRKGLRQAFRYRSWCDSSSLVLGRLPKDSSSLIDSAKRLQVGLACEDRWVVRPRIHELDPVKRFWGSEHVVASLGISSAKFLQL